MQIHNAVFVKSAPNIRQCPPELMPEYAFIGRSNVGKSSLINRLTNQKGLAKISSTPGKTQLINHFLIDGTWYLVDLPGYGWARKSKAARETFSQMIREYLGKRRSLLCTFLLIDSRLEPQKIDLEFMEWMAGAGLPFTLLYTKSDKLSATELEKKLAVYREKLLESWEELPPGIVTSSRTGAGKDEILQFIAETSKIFNPDLLRKA